jgi:predicted porin
MNKNILAIAIAAAVAAPSAFAAATVYGNMHVSGNSISGVKSTTPGASTTNTTGTSGLASNSSYVGVKGDEDLGGGMKAVFQVELGLDVTGNSGAGTDDASKNPSNGNGISSMRNTFVGVGGGFGTVLAGRHDSFIKATGRKYDLFGDQLGNNRNALGNANSTASFVVDGRHDNVLAYVSPSFSGVTFGAAYVNGNAVNQAGAGNVYDSDYNTNKAPALTAMLDYTAGNFSVTGGYINISKGADAATAGASTGDITAYRLGTGYSFGAAKVVALYQNDNILKAVGTANTGNRDTYGLGGSYKVGAAGTIKAQYYIASDMATNGANKNGGTLTTVGYDHALSKNTTAYAVYAAAHNDTAGSYSVDMSNSGSGSNVSAVTGKDNSAFSVGIIHKF